VAWVVTPSGIVVKLLQHCMALHTRRSEFILFVLICDKWACYKSNYFYSDGNRNCCNTGVFANQNIETSYEKATVFI
jgi:hypothetical protein